MTLAHHHSCQGTNASGQREIRQAITQYLAQREHGFNEIIQKLLLKGFDSQQAVAELEQFRAEGLQCDRRYASSLMQRRIARGYGEYYVRNEAVAKGLDGELVATVLAALAVDWQALASEAGQRKFGTQPPASERQQQKRCRFLLNRGFSAQQALAVYPCQEAD